MVPIPDSDLPRIIIIGGGFAGVKLVKKLKKLSFQIVLFDRNNYHTFQPLLYQVATAGLEPDSIADPLRKQLEPAHNFFFRMGEVMSVDPARNTISTEIGELNYDFLVIATGSKTNFFGNVSLMQHAFPLKQIPQALDLRSHILQNFEAATITEDVMEKKSRMNMVVVGGGPTGVEVAGALGELKRSILPNDYPELDFSKMSIILLEASSRLLGSMSEKSSERALRYLKKFHVDVYLNTQVETYDGKSAKLSNGEKINTHTLIWGAGVKGNYPDGLPEAALEKNRILVDEYSRVIGCDTIFAIGDIASMKTANYPQGHPMLAPVAIQQGDHLALNLRNLLDKKPLKPFKYFDKGSMATVGRNKAVVDFPRGGTLGGFPAWMVWMFIHLVSIIGFRNKLIVFLNWVWNYFTYDKGTRLIIRKFVPSRLRKKEAEVL
ncbi:MAG: NAD(P)/FAD-dependent oxidoreductase [Bacteroidota bacterium]